MEPNTSYKIVAFVFDESKKAVSVSNDLAAANKYAAYNVVAHAVVEVDDKGKPHLHETGHGRAGAAAGAVVGGLLGLIGGPAGLLLFTAAGAVIGGMAGQAGGRVIPTGDMKRLAGEMQASSSAMMALVEESQVETLIAAMASFEARVVVLALSDEVSGEIYHATAIPGESQALARTSAYEIRYTATPPGKATERSAQPSSTTPQTPAGAGTPAERS